MKADAHRCLASSLERAIALARPVHTTSVAVLENAWGVAYLYWLLSTSVREKGPLGCHRQPLSICQGDSATD